MKFAKNLALATATLLFIHAKAVELKDDAPIVSTLDEARSMNAQYDGDVRVENVNGTFAMIKHSTTEHIGTLEGDALAYLTDGIRKRDDGIRGRTVGPPTDPCVHRTCVLFTQCGTACTFCYPVVCL